MLAGLSSPPPRTVQELMGPSLMARLDRLDLLSRKVFAGKLPGERRSKRRGRSVEFDDYRDYAPGDDLRHLDWNVLARLDRFFIKLFREEEDLALHLVIDGSASMDAGTPGKLLFAQRLAMALGYIGLVNHNRVVMAAIGVPGRAAVQQLAAVRGRRSVERVARFILDNVRAAGTGAGPPDSGASGDSDAALDGPSEAGAGRAFDFNNALRTIAMSRAGRGVMVVLSDFLVQEGYQRGLNYLASGSVGGGLDTYCLQILSPGELDPAKEMSGGERAVIGDLRLTDAESGRAAEVTVTAGLLKRYKERVSRYSAELESFATARGMHFAMLSSDADLEPLLMEYLRRRGMLG